MSKEAMNLALEALNDIIPANANIEEMRHKQSKAAAALREALEKEALHKLTAESLNEGLRLDDWPKIGCVNHDCDQCKAQQEPLTDEQIKGIYEDCDAPTGGEFTIAFTRAIEAAHGITKGNT